MTLVFIAIDPDTTGDHCPAVFAEEETGDLPFQGWTVTDPQILARHMATRREQLEAANARYETWAAGTSERREAAGKASAELERRGLAQQAAGQRQPEPEGELGTMAEWWHQLDADLADADQAVEREHQAAHRRRQTLATPA